MVHEVVCIILTGAHTWFFWRVCALFILYTPNIIHRHGWERGWRWRVNETVNLLLPLRWRICCTFVYSSFFYFLLFALRFCFGWYFVAVYTYPCTVNWLLFLPATHHTRFGYYYCSSLFLYNAFSVFLWMGKIMVSVIGSWTIFSLLARWMRIHTHKVHIKV